MSIAVDPSDFKCLYIAQASESDIDKAKIGSIISQWWKVTDLGIEKIHAPEIIDCPSTSMFDPAPVIKFYLDGDRIVVSERLGPTLIARKTGRINNSGQWLNDLHIIWTSEP